MLSRAVEREPVRRHRAAAELLRRSELDRGRGGVAGRVALDSLADRDTKIYQLGFEPSEDYIKYTYGEGWTKKQAAVPPALLPGDVLPRNAPAQKSPADVKTQAFADAPATSKGGDGVALIAQQVDETSMSAMSALIDDIREILDTSQSVEEFQRRLLLAYPKLSLSALAAVIRDAMVTADLTGRVDQTEG